MGGLGTGIVEYADGMGSTDPVERQAGYDRWRELAVSTGVPFTFGLLATNPGGYEALAHIDAAAAAGARFIGQTHSRGISVLLSFQTRLPFDLLPEWAEVRALPLDEQQRALRDPAAKERLVRSAAIGDYGSWRGIGAQPRKPDFDGIRVYEHGLPPNPTINEVAQRRGVHPAEAMIDLALETNFEQLFIQPSLYPQDPEVVLAAMKHPRTVMTFSDSGAHLSQIADSSIHTHLLGHWVRDEQLLTLEEAVRMITLAPALAWGFSDRGLIREGLKADLNILDPKEVGPSVPKIVYDLPAGGKRLVQRSVGFKATVINGQTTITDGESTGALAGRLLRNRLSTR